MKLQNNHSEAVKHELNNEKHEYYKIELLLNYHLYWYNCKECWLEYKIKQKDYKSEFNSWKTEYELNCKKLIITFKEQHSLTDSQKSRIPSDKSVRIKNKQL